MVHVCASGARARAPGEARREAPEAGEEDGAAAAGDGDRPRDEEAQRGHVPRRPQGDYALTYTHTHSLSIYLYLSLSLSLSHTHKHMRKCKHTNLISYTRPNMDFVCVCVADHNVTTSIATLPIPHT